MTATDHDFELSEWTFSGTRGIIAARRWQGSEVPRYVVLITHGYGEHIGRYDAVAAALIDHGFCDLNARKLWLDTSGENLRAQRVYARAGFVLEGRLRQHDHVPRIGRVVDTLLYGMLRDEWAVLPR